VLELSLREAMQPGHNYIGTEHILLGLIREGEGVAAQVLVKLGADLNTVRQQVIQLLGPTSAEPVFTPVAPPAKAERRLLDRVLSRVNGVEARLSGIEQRVGTGPDTGGLDQQIAQVRSEKELAVTTQDYEQAASLRDRERNCSPKRPLANRSGQPRIPASRTWPQHASS
jgi:ATP-dependent Clp protease ATP-binding subunit ClpA